MLWTGVQFPPSPPFNASRPVRFDGPICFNWQTIDVNIIECNFDAHGQQVLDILNHEIRYSTSLYDYSPRTLDDVELMFHQKKALAQPLIGAVADTGELMGFATFGQFRPRPANKYSVEHSVYVAESFRNNGVGKALLVKLIELAKTREIRNMIGAIDAANAASIRLHESLGFKRVGTVPEVGFKFGRWLDLALYQLPIKSDFSPVDG
jgi:L-amino acid N-acyltransferase